MPKKPRVCGSCSWCCIALSISKEHGEIAKPEWEPCRFLGKKGCSRHFDPTRPALCGSFRCLWLDGACDQYDRPDTCGILLYTWRMAGHPVAVAKELWNGAKMTKAGMRVILKSALSVPCLVVATWSGEKIIMGDKVVGQLYLDDLLKEKNDAR